MIVVRRLLAVVLVSLCFQVVLAGPLDQCQEYVRYGTPSDKGDLLCRTGYALAHNPAHKTPDWVAERLTREAIAAMSQEEYRALDVVEFARANLRHYTEHPGVLEKIYTVADPELLRKHLAYLDAVGETRAQILFTTLRRCCSLVVPQAMTEEVKRV